VSPGPFSARHMQLQSAQFCLYLARVVDFDRVRAVTEEGGPSAVSCGNRSSRIAFNSDL
jgi:hypothetical protein